MSILACDPGLTSGFALYDNLGEYYCWQLDCRNLSTLWNWLTDINPTTIVYEDFKYRPNLMKVELHSLKVIAVLELYLELRGEQVAARYLPAETKRFWDDRKIKALGLWRPGLNHAMDALRVLLNYRGKTDLAWFKEILPKLR